MATKNRTFNIGEFSIRFGLDCTSSLLTKQHLYRFNSTAGAVKPMSDNDMPALIRSVHTAVMEQYERSKPWDVDFVKFAIHFDERGRILEITYTPIPSDIEDIVVDRVVEVSQRYGERFKDMVVNVVVGFKSPSRN
jgi:hypothetical protein